MSKFAIGLQTSVLNALSVHFHHFSAHRPLSYSENESESNDIAQ